MRATGNLGIIGGAGTKMKLRRSLQDVAAAVMVNALALHAAYKPDTVLTAPAKALAGLKPDFCRIVETEIVGFHLLVTWWLIGNNGR